MLQGNCSTAAASKCSRCSPCGGAASAHLQGVNVSRPLLNREKGQQRKRSAADFQHTEPIHLTPAHHLARLLLLILRCSMVRQRPRLVARRRLVERQQLVLPWLRGALPAYGLLVELDAVSVS